jgi:hypothetical protein
MKKILFIILIIAVLIGGFWWFSKNREESGPISECQVKEITFYYLDNCVFCNKVKDEGTIDKIEQLGVKVNKINAAVGPIDHQFTGVPTFVITGKVYEGYRTFEEIKALLKCPEGT